MAGARRGWWGRPWKNQWTAKANYPFLNSSFCQCVSVAEIIDFYVLDIVPILLIRLAGDGLARIGGRRPDHRRTNGLGESAIVANDGVGEHTERIGGTSTCWMPFFAWICALILAAAAAAAAAASVTLAFFSAFAGLSEAPRPMGLRVRRDSGSRLDGDRERRSKRERGGRSDSSRSKRERGRGSSDMLGERAEQELLGRCSEVEVRWRRGSPRNDSC